MLGIRKGSCVLSLPLAGTLESSVSLQSRNHLWYRFYCGWEPPSCKFSVFLGTLRGHYFFTRGQCVGSELVKTELGLNPVLSNSKALWLLFGIISWNSCFRGTVALICFQGQSWPKLWCFTACSSQPVFFSPPQSFTLPGLLASCCLSFLFRIMWGSSQVHARLYVPDSARRWSSTLKLPVLGLSPSWLQNLMATEFIEGHSLSFSLRLFGF